MQYILLCLEYILFFLKEEKINLQHVNFDVVV